MIAYTKAMRLFPGSGDPDWSSVTRSEMKNNAARNAYVDKYLCGIDPDHVDGDGHLCLPRPRPLVVCRHPLIFTRTFVLMLMQCRRSFDKEKCHQCLPEDEVERSRRVQNAKLLVCAMR